MFWEGVAFCSHKTVEEKMKLGVVGPGSDSSVDSTAPTYAPELLRFIIKNVTQLVEQFIRITKVLADFL